MTEEIKLLVEQIKSITRNKHTRKLISELKQKLAKLMDKDEMFISGFYLVKQTHAWGQTVAFFKPDSWDRYQKYLHPEPKNNLDWIQ